MIRSAYSSVNLQMYNTRSFFFKSTVVYVFSLTVKNLFCFMFVRSLFNLLGVNINIYTPTTQLFAIFCFAFILVGFGVCILIFFSNSSRQYSSSISLNQYRMKICTTAIF